MTQLAERTKLIKPSSLWRSPPRQVLRAEGVDIVNFSAGSRPDPEPWRRCQALRATKYTTSWDRTSAAITEIRRNRAAIVRKSGKLRRQTLPVQRSSSGG
jgi:hypothetical protein